MATKPVWLEPRWIELVRLINVYGLKERESGGDGGNKETADAYKAVQMEMARIELKSPWRSTNATV